MTTPYDALAVALVIGVMTLRAELRVQRYKRILRRRAARTLGSGGGWHDVRRNDVETQERRVSERAKVLVVVVFAIASVASAGGLLFAVYQLVLLTLMRELASADQAALDASTFGYGVLAVVAVFSWVYFWKLAGERWVSLKEGRGC